MADNSQGSDPSDPEDFPFPAAFINLGVVKDKEYFLRVPEGYPRLECLFSWPIDEYIVSPEIRSCHSRGLSLEICCNGPEHNSRFDLFSSSHPPLYHPSPPVKIGCLGDAALSGMLSPAAVADRRTKWDIRSSTRQPRSGGHGMPDEWSAPRGR